MRELFDTLLIKGEAGIDRLVSERTQESVTLDFKEKRVAASGALDNEDRKTLAKALSAFANSTGGLLIYGVKARKGADQVDCAQEAKPIHEIERFASEVTTASGQLLQPRHDGIEVRVVPSDHSPGAGYLLVFVQRSERRPHRSEAKDQKQYFKRAGDSSFEMEHYDIEDAFRRISTPDLAIKCIIEDDINFGGKQLYNISLYMQNRAVVTAKFSFLQIANICGKFLHPHPDLISVNYETSVDGQWTSYMSRNNEVINHGLKSLVVRKRVDLEFRNNMFSILGDYQVAFVSFDYRIGCENCPTKEGNFTFTLRDANTGR